MKPLRASTNGRPALRSAVLLAGIFVASGGAWLLSAGGQRAPALHTKATAGAEPDSPERSIEALSAQRAPIRPGEEPAVSTRSAIDAGGPSRDAPELTLPGVLHGLLLTEGYEPAAGVRVVAETHSWNAQAIVDQRGSFSFSDLPDRGDLFISARHPDYGTWAAEHQVPGDSADLDIGTVVMKPAGVLEGRVVGADGMGVPKLQVLLQPRRTEAHLLEAGVWGLDVTSRVTDLHDVGLHRATGVDGAFRFADLDPSTEYQVRLGKRPMETRFVHLTPSQLDLILETSVVGTRIRFMDRAGDSVSELSLHAEPLEGNAEARHQITRLGDGTYALHADAPQTMTVVGEASRGNRMLLGMAQVQVGAGIPLVEIILDEVSVFPMTWEVLDPSGDSIDDYLFRIYDAHSGAALPFLTDRGQPVERFPAGLLHLEVRPAAASFALPFTCDVTISTLAPSHVVLRASDWGGALEVQRSKGGALARMDRLAVRSGETAVTNGLYTSFRHQPIREAIPEGPYVLDVSDPFGGASVPPHHSWPIEIRRREVTQVDLSTGVLGDR